MCSWHNLNYNKSKHLFSKPEIVFQFRLSYYSKITLGLFYQALTHPTYIREVYVLYPTLLILVCVDFLSVITKMLGSCLVSRTSLLLHNHSSPSKWFISVDVVSVNSLWFKQSTVQTHLVLQIFCPWKGLNWIKLYYRNCIQYWMCNAFKHIHLQIPGYLDSESLHLPAFDSVYLCELILGSRSLYWG